MQRLSTWDSQEVFYKDSELMTYKISNTRSLGDLPIPNIWLWLNLCNLNPMSRLVTADNIWTAAEAAVTPFILSDPPVFLLAMQIQKFTKHTNICQCKGGKLNCKGRNKNFFETLSSAFVAKSIKTLLQIQAQLQQIPGNGVKFLPTKKGLRKVKTWK